MCFTDILRQPESKISKLKPGIQQGADTPSTKYQCQTGVLQELNEQSNFLKSPRQIELPCFFRSYNNTTMTNDGQRGLSLEEDRKDTQRRGVDDQRARSQRWHSNLRIILRGTAREHRNGLRELEGSVAL